MSSSLYELTKEMQYLMDMLEEPEADEQTIQDTMEGLDYEIEQKADGYAKIIKILEGRLEMVDKEYKRLAELKSSIKHNIERLKQNLGDSMITLDKRKFKTDLFSFWIQKNPPSVNITGDVPESFLIPQEPKVDNKGIIEMLKENGNTEWAELTQSESIRIR